MRIKIILTLLMMITIISFTKNKGEVIPLQSAANDTSKINSAQTYTDSVNISEMVLAQIQAAQKKQIEEKNQSMQPPVAAVTKTQSNISANFVNDWIKTLSLSEDTMIKIIILGSATLVAVIFISFRRMRSGHKNSNKRDLKNGIKLMREEKVFGKNNEKLSGIRTKLSNSPSSYQLSNESISRNARDLKIAKEEIYLAARIKSHELNQASGGSLVRKKMR
ncbi:MAG: hypothetical protein M1480_16870 [Bacteroidetes bacterium]|nr:hypothetical protein [Bacteroidota bacterium]